MVFMSNHITIIHSPVPTAATFRDHARRVAAYLPSNYSIVDGDDNKFVVIVGMDSMGWTAEDYVIPRLGSGCMVGKVVMTIPVTEDLREMILFATPVSN